MKDKTVGFAMCGSFCTFKYALLQMEALKSLGYKIVPIMSFNAYSLDTRFGTAESFIEKAENICEHEIISTLNGAEPIGPQKLLDILLIEPCTGNTIAKLAAGIADTPVTLSAKSHLRNSRPVLIAVSTNDALGTAAQNIGRLMNYKNVFFVPMAQDDTVNKPKSIVVNFESTAAALEQALEGKQIQPVYL